ncbi:MAG: hypothetical protein ACXAAO_00365 [Candidatus Thorarchaeota archaeon]
MDDFLREVACVEKDVSRVFCEVRINVEKKMYEVELRGRSRDTIMGTLHFSDTSEIVKTLRHPIRLGTPLKIEKRSLVMWDHQRDIRYLGCELMRGETREILSVSFLRPLVHRSRFHHDKFQYPETCDELLSARKGKRTTLVIVPNDNNWFSVRLHGLSTESSLKALEGLELNVFDLALLAECEQLFDTTNKTRHEVLIDASQISDLRFSQLSSYPRLHEAVSRTKTDWSIGTWTIEVTEAMDSPDEVLWKIGSKKTGKMWKNRTFSFQLDYSKSLREHVRVFERSVGSVIPLKHITDLSDTLVVFEETLRGKGLGEEKVRCRLDHDVREGKDVGVVSLVEQEGGTREIRSFPIETTDLESIRHFMVADGGLLSLYDVVNLEEFYGQVQLIKSTVREESRSDEEEDADLLTVIKEYRDEGDRRGLGHSLVLLAQEKLTDGRTGEAEEAVNEAITLLIECDPDNRLVRSDLARALVTKAELIIEEDRELEVARSLLLEAKKLVRSLLDTLRPGRTDVIVQETSDWIDRLIQEFHNSDNA